MQEPRGTEAAQIGDDRSKAVLGQRADYAIPCSRVVREAMQEDNGLSVGFTVFFIGDLQGVGPDSLQCCWSAHCRRRVPFHSDKLQTLIPPTVLELERFDQGE